jgi:cyclopropane-fatty-acyl-phospholipid synthase
MSGSEIAFRREGHMVFQIQLAHQQTAVPLTRDYITDVERRAMREPARREPVESK